MAACRHRQRSIRRIAMKLSKKTIKQFRKAEQTEGWGIFNCDGIEQIQRVDEFDGFFGRRFLDDDEAIAFVTKRAAKGSKLHQMALAIVVASKIAQGELQWN
jgi:hypothetical protein